MGIRTKEYDTFLRKKTEGEQNSGITMISVDGKGKFFEVEITRGIVWIKKTM